ncbi:MAG: hypothetical protein ACLR78_12500 [Roseburia sp.]
MKKGFLLAGNAGTGPAGSFQQALPERKEFLDDWLARTVELIVPEYRPKLCISTWWSSARGAFHPYLKKLAAFYYNCW